jgi:formylglycine-generating enzyme required for sulfatase activity
VSHHHNDRTDGFLYVSPVRAFPPNAWGIYDPVGNVWQWTADAYASDAYARAAQGLGPSPRGPPRIDRVLRGGSWWCGVCTCEGMGLFYRGKASPIAPYNNNGFRCAR